MNDSQGLGDVKSFILAFFIYIALVAFVIFRLSIFKDQAIRYTNIKESFIDIQFGESTTVIPKKNTSPTPVNSEIKSVKVEKKTIQQAVKTQDKEIKNDYNALFSNIKEIPPETSDKVQSSAKTVEQNSAPSTAASDLLKQLDQNLIQEQAQVNGQTTNLQMTGIYDEFLGTLRRILEERWRLYEAEGNFEAQVTFFVDSNGKFGYTSVSKTYDEKFDAKVLEFLDNLTGKYIALPPKNETYNGNLNLSDKIKIGE
ncbi:TonB C-terminal domain-containing protein [Campylobacter sp. US33a]|uniref:TonB C-terminal domain-containing protein n=1 Tax=Campylobacter sp. US33a TaxID=2498120 RepID=UPI0010685E26|nr:TonB C-terminal domain-containing protein [Campylobacter sp. US33a]TEY03127.1 energy transducer TonB [Campylobacter sp. US33a]